MVASTLTLPKGFDGIPTSWFPDTTHLLVNNGEGLQHTAKIWKVSILGGDPQMLLEDAEQGTVSPDGSQILFFREDVDLRQPWLAPPTAGPRIAWRRKAGALRKDDDCVVSNLVA